MAWCALHSFLISMSVTEWLRKRFPGEFRFYRILFNLISSVTLLPVLYYSYHVKGYIWVTWVGPLRIIQVLLLLTAFIFFVAGARRYDLAQFMGWRQIHDEKTCSVLTDDCSLDTRGILSVVRHPWYTGGILIVWARPLDLGAILTNLVVCGYFLLGALLEERKLHLQFGDQYQDYQKRVSMLLPIKWVSGIIKKP
jgi:methanethiol S-methyltransferase